MKNKKDTATIPNAKRVLIQLLYPEEIQIILNLAKRVKSRVLGVYDKFYFAVLRSMKTLSRIRYWAQEYVSALMNSIFIVIPAKRGIFVSIISFFEYLFLAVFVLFPWLELSFKMVGVQ